MLNLTRRAAPVLVLALLIASAATPVAAWHDELGDPAETHECTSEWSDFASDLTLVREPCSVTGTFTEALEVIVIIPEGVVGTVDVTAEDAYGNTVTSTCVAALVMVTQNVGVNEFQCLVLLQAAFYMGPVTVTADPTLHGVYVEPYVHMEAHFW
jgi:hypothetical protein